MNLLQNSNEDSQPPVFRMREGGKQNIHFDVVALSKQKYWSEQNVNVNVN